MPIYMQQGSWSYINGGGRGFLVALDPKEAQRVLKPTLVDVATT
jgi:prolyl-tRNA editing enzyme YbaK/EbsC (Cys-tRNA(Pro) deacylase)